MSTMSNFFCPGRQPTDIALREMHARAPAAEELA
jgi:hypothetical protein